MNRTKTKIFEAVASVRRLCGGFTKDRRDSNAEREIPRAAFFADTAFRPAPVVPLSFCAGKQPARCPSRGATAAAHLHWRAAIGPHGCAHRATSTGVRDLRRRGLRATRAPRCKLSAHEVPLSIVSRVQGFLRVLSLRRLASP